MTQASPEIGARHWLKKNLFGGAANSLVSLFLITTIFFFLARSFEWAVLNGVWNAGSLEECQAIIAKTHGPDASGACWAVLRERFGQLLFGFYPQELYWRPVLTFVLLLAAISLFFFRNLPSWTRGAPVIFPIVAYFLLWGGGLLEEVETRKFGGLMLVMIVASSGSAMALPMAIAVAMGRLYLILPFRFLCGSIIAVSRGVPLVVLLFATSLLAGLMSPPGLHVGPLFRASVVIALHTGGRMAGALVQEMKELPRGQQEAAMSLGFGQRQALWVVLLPQAFTNLIPWIALAAAGAVRDVSLLALIGLLEPIGLMNAIQANTNWNGIVWELALFVGALYGGICFA